MSAQLGATLNAFVQQIRLVPKPQSVNDHEFWLGGSEYVGAWLVRDKNRIAECARGSVPRSSYASLSRRGLYRQPRLKSLLVGVHDQRVDDRLVSGFSALTCQPRFEDAESLLGLGRDLRVDCRVVSGAMVSWRHGKQCYHETVLLVKRVAIKIFSWYNGRVVSSRTAPEGFIDGLDDSCVVGFRFSDSGAPATRVRFGAIVAGNCALK